MATEGTSTSSDQERMEACQSAVNILAQGKRNMVCGEIPTAVNQFQEACRILSKAYGETAKECADAYFCYGQALLDLARMENGVLGNALQGVPETDDETVEQKEEKDEQFEKGELEATEREKLRKEVYDAMGEKEQEKAEREKKELEKKKETGETMEIADDTEEKGKEDAKDEAAKLDKTKEEDSKKEDDTQTDERKSKEESDKEKLKDEKKSEDVEMKDDGMDRKDNTDKEKKEEKDVEMKEDDKTKKDEEEASAEEGEDGEAAEGEEGEGTEEEGEAEGEAVEGENAEGDETTSQDGSQDGENPDDVSNLQLAWEMLELAKLIYLKDESKEAKLRAAESHLKLGEVSLETEQYEEAIKDLNKCLELQKELLDADNRLLAETHYQLGLAYCFNKQFQESTDSYQSAIKVIEERIANLDKILEKATDEEKETKDFDHPVYKAKKEVDELKEILPDIKAKIEDVEDEKKNMNELKDLAKEAMGGLASSAASSTSEAAPGEPKEEVKASDISHLIKRKRKSEEPEEESAKKAKQEVGAGDAPAKGDEKPAEEKTEVNGHTEKEAAPEAMETKS